MGCMGLCGGVHTDETDTVTDAYGFQPHFIGLGLSQCEYTLNAV